MAYAIVAGVRYDLPEELTIGEALDVARELGPASDTEIGRHSGLVWIAVRRVYPKTTLADLQNEPYNAYDDDDDRLPPTSGAANGSPVDRTPTEPAPAPTGTPGSDTTTESDPMKSTDTP